MQRVHPPHLLTVAEYLALGETELGYDEVVEGRVVLSPTRMLTTRTFSSRRCSTSPRSCRLTSRCCRTSTSAWSWPRPALPASPAGRTSSWFAGPLANGAGSSEPLRSSSWRSSSPPGSKRTDHVAKRADYADAGIPHYWIVDLDDPISLVACHRGGELGYIDGGAVTGVFDTTEPFPVRLDLGALG